MIFQVEQSRRSRSFQIIAQQNVVSEVEGSRVASIHRLACQVEDSSRVRNNGIIRDEKSRVSWSDKRKYVTGCAAEASQILVVGWGSSRHSRRHSVAVADRDIVDEGCHSRSCVAAPLPLLTHVTDRCRSLDV